jgi:putative heme-binding domain-containing protein
MFARDDRAIALLESDAIKPTDLTASQVQSLVHHKSAKVSDVAKKVLASMIPPSREEVVAKFKPALELKGNTINGQNLYISRCMACHRAGTMGLQVGPDLVTVKTKGRDGILTAILEPNKEVAAQYIAYIVNTKDGQTLTGVVAEDNATSLTLKMMAGVSQTIQRSNIKGSSSSGQSLMPEGLEQGMTVQEMADLVTFIEDLK